MLFGGLVSITFRALGVGEIVGLGAEAGLAGIEWGGDVHVPHGDVGRAAEARRVTEGAGLAVAAYGSYYRAGESEGAGLSFASVAETARALGAPTVRVWAGTKGSAESDGATRARVADDLRRIAGIAAAAGMTVSLEFHGGTLTDRADSAVALFRAVDHPALRAYWQPAVGATPEGRRADLAAVAPWLTHAHVFQWRTGFRDRLPLAEGAAEWRGYLRDLAALPGDRHALLEFVAGDAPEAFLRDAATLRGWLAEANAGAV